MTILPLLMILPVLAIAAVSDLRQLRIPNVLPIILVSVFALTSLVAAPPDLMPRVAVAATALAIGLLAFALRLVGGGDVKLLAALMLFIPVGSVLLFANIFAVSLLFGVALLLGLRRVLSARPDGWKGLARTKKFPMGISIAFAGFAHCAALYSLELR